MSQRSCPSCGLDVAPHQTLCPSCRTPVPSEAGPVAPSAEGTGIVVGAPPPRRGEVEPGAPPARPDRAEPPAPGPATGAAPDLALPPAVAEGSTGSPDVDSPPGASPFAPPTHGASRDVAPAPPPPTPIPPPPPSVPLAPPVLDVPQPVPAQPAQPAPAQPGASHPGPPAWGQGQGPVAAPGVGPAPAPSAGTLGVPGAAVLDERSNAPGGVVALVGAVLVVVGVFLPWMEVAGEAVSGWRSSDDAKVLLVFAAVVTVTAALVIGGARSLVLRIGLALVGLATVVLGVLDVLSVDDLGGDVAFGPGLVAVLVGGVLVVVGALLTRHRRFR